MRQLFFYGIFLLFACKIMAQPIASFSTLGLNGNVFKSKYKTGGSPNNRKVINESGVSLNYQYNTFCRLKQSNLYLVAGINGSANFKNFFFDYSHNIGVGKKFTLNANSSLFTSINGRFSMTGNGVYANAYFTSSIKKVYFVIAPEISYLRINKDELRPELQKANLFSFGGTIGLGLAEKEKEALNLKTEARNNHFSVDISMGYRNLYRLGVAPFKGKLNFIQTSITYRFMPQYFISPEAGLGFIYSKTPEIKTILPISPIGNSYYLETSTEYVPYIKIGAGIDTKGISDWQIDKLSFMASSFFLKPINLDGRGYVGSFGLKYNVFPKLAFSLSPEVIVYNGKFFGTYRKYGETHNGVSIDSDVKRNLSDKNRDNYAAYVKLGVHF